MISRNMPSNMLDAGGIALAWKEIDIGVWNMDATSSVNIAHGLVVTTIISVSVHIYNDALNQVYPIDYSSAANIVAGSTLVNAGNINIQRFAGGIFDSANFDDAVMNRGHILIIYQP